MSPYLLDEDRCPHCREPLESRDLRVCPACGGSLQKRFLRAGCLSSKPLALLLLAALWLLLR